MPVWATAIPLIPPDTKRKINTSENNNGNS